MSTSPLHPESGVPWQDPYVKKLALLCDMHRVPVGSPADLSGFMRTLEENKHLAMDFWALVARMSDEESGVAGSARILEVVVQCVTGARLAEVKRKGGEEARLVGELASMLAGEDVHNPAVESTTTDVAESAAEVALVEEPAEPSAAKTPASFPAEVAVPLASVREEPEPVLLQREPRENRRIVLQPEPIVATGPVARGLPEKEADLDIPVPLAAYAESNPSRKSNTLAIVLVVVILAGAGIFFGQKYGPELWQRYGASLQGIFGSASKDRVSTQDATANSPAPDSSSQNDAVDHQAGTGTAEQSKDVTPQPRTPVPQEPRAASQSPAAPIVRQPAPQVEGAPTTPIRPRRRASEEEEEEIVEESVPSSAVPVSPAAMEANLISSRVPAYPEVAKARHIEGRVVMQAIVSKNGTVGHLRVLSGDPMLRSAATEAVSTWRYRPYLVNGQPVDVTTLVSVDFKLDR